MIDKFYTFNIDFVNCETNGHIYMYTLAEESYPDNDVETPKSRKKRNIETMSESGKTLKIY